jgi:hypothetical protein
MPKLVAEEADVDRLTMAFAAYPGLDHLRVRRRADLLVVESGPKDDPIPHARFRRATLRAWDLEMATHTGRWEPSGERGELIALTGLLVSAFRLDPDPYRLTRYELSARGTSCDRGFGSWSRARRDPRRVAASRSPRARP